MAAISTIVRMPSTEEVRDIHRGSLAVVSACLRRVSWAAQLTDNSESCFWQSHTATAFPRDIVRRVDLDNE